MDRIDIETRAHYEEMEDINRVVSTDYDEDFDYGDPSCSLRNNEQDAFIVYSDEEVRQIQLEKQREAELTYRKLEETLNRMKLL